MGSTNIAHGARPLTQQVALNKGRRGTNTTRTAKQPVGPQLMACSCVLGMRQSSVGRRYRARARLRANGGKVWSQENDCGTRKLDTSQAAVSNLARISQVIRASQHGEQKLQRKSGTIRPSQKAGAS